jgi:GntR family transcriptional regulator
MLLYIEKGSSTPISRQIADQVRAQCLSGALEPGTKLPSVRELAHQLAVNVNTVVRVYERLAAERLVEMRHGDGTYVLESSTRTASALNGQKAKFDAEFESMVQRGLLLGLTPAELRERMRQSLSSARAAGSRPEHSRESDHA